MAYAAPLNWKVDGERLHYSVEMWGWLDVGEAELLYRTSEDNAYTILARAWTSLSAFRLRDRLTTHGVHTEGAETGSFYPREQIIELNENDYRGHKVITFEREDSKVRYHNIQGKEEPVSYDAPAHVRDMLSALYYYRDRIQNARVGERYTHAIAQNDYIYQMTLTIADKGKIDGHKVLKVIPKMQKLNRDGSPLGDEKDTWVIWVRDDASFVPERIEARTKFGAFVAKLKHYGKSTAPSRVIPQIPETGPISMSRKAEKSLMLETVD